uniref:Chitin-binding type-2 domain-containing protein n=1 Tax=Elaeophora elaphi TaxID=1147741 RepID=A0A0R3S5A0_9BILA
MTSSEFTCKSKPDGGYARGCTAEFVMCTSGLATYYRCSPPLMYDIDSQMCHNQVILVFSVEAESSKFCKALKVGDRI